MMDLFNTTPVHECNKTLVDFIQSNDNKGIINYLEKLPKNDFVEEVLKAGYSMISFRHGKQKVINHIYQQIQKT